MGHVKTAVRSGSREYASLREWRKAHELTQAIAASRFGFSLQFWSELERGNRRPSPETAKALHIATGVPFDTLLGLR